MELTILITVQNEAKTIKLFLEKINAIPLEKEIIIVDDGSTDGTDKILRELKADNIKIIHHATARGRSAAFLTGLINSTGTYVLSVNTDFNFEQLGFLSAFEALKNGKAEIALGTRNNKNYLGSKLLTIFLNLLYSAKLNSYTINWKLASKAVWNDLKAAVTNFDSDLKVIRFILKNRKKILEIEERL